MLQIVFVFSDSFVIPNIASKNMGYQLSSSSPTQATNGISEWAKVFEKPGNKNAILGMVARLLPAGSPAPEQLSIRRSAFLASLLSPKLAARSHPQTSDLTSPPVLCPPSLSTPSL